MFYKPKFCCNCGEKIERADWKLWTSRRFCEFCEIEQKQHDLLPKALAALAIVIGIFGFGSYLRSEKPDSRNQASRKDIAPKARFTEVSSQTLPAGPNKNSADAEKLQEDETALMAKANTISPADEPNKQLDKRKFTSDERVYFCGAMTKKGTPCSRRVKMNARCWQHSGRSSSLPTGKLDLNASANPDRK